MLMSLTSQSMGPRLSNQVAELRGFQEIECHIIFDVKMDFTRKARFVAGGHMTEACDASCLTLERHHLMTLYLFLVIGKSSTGTLSKRTLRTCQFH